MQKKYSIVLLIIPFYLNAMGTNQLILGEQYYFTDGRLQGIMVIVEDTAEQLASGPLIKFSINTEPTKMLFRKNVYFAKDENGQGYFIDSSMVQKIEKLNEFNYAK